VGADGPILAVRGLSKSFGGTRALSSVDLDVAAGEIHGLLGQNGSGKSTLIKLLSGFHAPDTGEVSVHGTPVRLPATAGELRRLGVEFVHQDLGLVDGMSVLENIRVGRYETASGWRIRWRHERARCAGLLRRFGLDLDPDTEVRRLSRAERTIVAIVRALQDLREDAHRSLLVLDEPTASLPAHEVDVLFDAMRRITVTGCAVLFVTHDLDEVFRVCDRVSVLRDGRRVATLRAGDLDQHSLVELIVGRDPGDLYPAVESHAAAPVLEVRGISGDVARDVALTVRRGEVVGLTGLVGAGHDELPYLLYGAPPPRSGTIVVDGRPIGAPTPQRCKAAGIALLPADRQRHSGVPRATLGENVTMPSLSTFRRWRGLDRRAERTAIEQVLDHFGVRPAEPDRPLYTLSGGNQQKALLGRWLRTEPRVLLLHEPTQGVDVGARTGIFEILRSSAAAGRSIVYASAEYDDLAHICDRVVVFRRGRVVADLGADALSHEQIVSQCYQGSAA
jgi:ribose transport system ATP-binding protein